MTGVGIVVVVVVVAARHNGPCCRVTRLMTGLDETDRTAGIRSSRYHGNARCIGIPTAIGAIGFIGRPL
jgi:hypothetical protein